MHIPLEQGVIRDFRISDAASLALQANNPNIARNMRDLFPHPYHESDARTYIECVIDANQACNFAIDVDGAAVGSIGLRLRTDVDRVGAELGYWIGEPFWGRGIVADAVRAFTPFALEQFELTRIEAFVFHWNPASARVLEKAGFQFEATLRKSAVKRGQVIDRLLYAYLRK